MGAGTVGRHRHSGPFELLSKAYRPVPHAQHRFPPPLAARRQAPGEVGGADRERLHDAAAVAVERGEDLAAARVDHRQDVVVVVRLRAERERLEAGDADQRHVVALRERARGRDAEPESR